MKKIIFFVFLATAICTGSLCVADEISGKADAIDTASKTITVSGVKITAAASRIENEMDMPVDFSALAVGNHLEIEGLFGKPAEMTATKIEKKAGGKNTIKGRVEKIDPANKQIVIGGVTVRPAPNAYIEGYNDAPIPLEQIPVGAYVDCEGNWSKALAFEAYKIELD